MSSFGNIARLVHDRLEVRAKAAAYRDDPVLWAEEYLGLQLWSKQKEILYSIRDNRATAVAAGHGVGKSFVAGVAACWWMDVHPVDQVALVSTAPTVAQTDILWNNIKVFYALAERRFKEGLVDHKLPGYITSDNKWRFEGRKIGEGRKPAEQTASDSLQGTHATYLLAIGDEAVGLSSKILQALGNMATGPYNRQLLIANPTDPSSAMAQIWKKELSQWTRMHIGVFDSPAITKEPGFDISQASALSGIDYVDQMREQWGEDHPFYISRVLGQWAFDRGNTVFNEEEITSAVNAHVVVDPEAPIHLGCDIAWSEKGDFSSVYECQEGEVWEVDEDTGRPVRPTGKRGWRIRLVNKWKGAPLAGHNPDNPSNADRIVEHGLGKAASYVKVDNSGVGAAVVHDLATRDVPFDIYKMQGGDPARESKTYINARAEAFFDLKLAAHQGLLDLDGDDEELIDQLRGIQYEYDSRNKIKIQSKADMRKEGKKSPDFADAAWYAFYVPEDLREDVAPKKQVVTFEPEMFVPEWFADPRGLPV